MVLKLEESVRPQAEPGGRARPQADFGKGWHAKFAWGFH